MPSHVRQKLNNKDLILSKIRLLSGLSRLNSQNLWPERHYLMLFNRIAFSNTFHTYVKTFAISIIYVKIFTFSLHCKNSIITVVTYANWKLLVIGVKLLEHAMHMEGVLLAAYVGCQSCFNRSDRCIYWPEQGNCLPIFGAFSILLHWQETSVNWEKHEKDKMTEDSNTHGSEES
jgi:hypothetical protein